MGSPVFAPPNLYQLHGHNLQVTYATSGFDGKPHLQYHDSFQTLQFSGTEIRTVESEIDTLVTVTIRLTVDTGSTTFTVLIPTVNLGSSGHAAIRTFGVTTVHRFSVVPILNQGQTELYTVTEDTDTASHVVFVQASTGTGAAAGSK